MPTDGTLTELEQNRMDREQIRNGYGMDTEWIKNGNRNARGMAAEHVCQAFPIRFLLIGTVGFF